MDLLEVMEHMKKSEDISTEVKGEIVDYLNECLKTGSDVIERAFPQEDDRDAMYRALATGALLCVASNHPVIGMYINLLRDEMAKVVATGIRITFGAAEKEKIIGEFKLP